MRENLMIYLKEARTSQFMNMQSHSDGQVVAGEPFTHKDYPPGTWISIDETLLKHMDAPFAGKKVKATTGWRWPSTALFDGIDPMTTVPIEWERRIYLVPQQYMKPVQQFLFPNGNTE